MLTIPIEVDPNRRMLLAHMQRLDISPVIVFPVDLDADFELVRNLIEFCFLNLASMPISEVTKASRLGTALELLPLIRFRVLIEADCGASFIHEAPFVTISSL